MACTTHVHLPPGASPTNHNPRHPNSQGASQKPQQPRRDPKKLEQPRREPEPEQQRCEAEPGQPRREEEAKEPRRESEAREAKMFDNQHVVAWVEGKQIRGSIVVSISACHAEDPGSIPGRGMFAYLVCGGLTCADLRCADPKVC